MAFCLTGPGRGQAKGGDRMAQRPRSPRSIAGTTQKQPTLHHA